MTEPTADAGFDRDVAAAYAAIVQSSDDAIYSKDRDGKITTWNPAAVTLYGYDVDEACGRHISLIVPPERKGEEMDILARILAGERIDHYETQRVCKNGDRVDMSISVSPIHDKEGNIVEASVIARDVTAQKRLTEELEKARAREMTFRRKQALELNDQVVQGLVAAKLAFESGKEGAALKAVVSTLERAKGVVTRLLDDYREEEGGLEPGDLVLNGPTEAPNPEENPS